MRKRIMDGLRKAGDKVKDMDKAYAEKIAKFIEGDPSTRGNGPIGLSRGLGGMVAASQPGDKIFNRELLGTPEWEQINPLLRATMQSADWGMPAAGLGIRYGIPAAGVTLAGKGLIDIANSFGGPADEPQPSEIPLD